MLNQATLGKSRQLSLLFVNSRQPPLTYDTSCQQVLEVPSIASTCSSSTTSVGFVNCVSGDQGVCTCLFRASAVRLWPQECGHAMLAA